MLGSAHNWFFANVETGIYDNRQSGETLVFGQQAGVARIVLLSHNLWSGGSIYVKYCPAAGLNFGINVVGHGHKPRGRVPPVPASEKSAAVFFQKAWGGGHKPRA